jgi:hypothetical protein
MISKDEAIAQFKSLLGPKGSWAQIADSQFVHHMAVFSSWALRQALWKIERSYQEFFRSTAATRPSILAHVEDENYIPLRAVPSSGSCVVTNNGISGIEISARHPFESSSQIMYSCDDPISLGPGESGTYSFSQMTQTSYNHTVTEEKAFFEIFFDKGLSEKICGIDVYVDGEKWELATKFQNVSPEDKVYDEFYSHTDQAGIRFGNGIFGKIPDVGSVVTVKLFITDGDTYLAGDQSLDIIGEVIGLDGNPVDVSVRTSGEISGGSAMEDKESIRRNLQYWPIYNQQLVWDEDYKYYLRRNFPNLTWINVWGEKEAEQQAGSMSLDFINTIFVSAYESGGADVSADIIESLEQVAAKLNRRFQWVAPVPVTFSVAVTGKVTKARNLAEVSLAIESILESNYGPDSSSRKNEVYINDIYQLIDSTGYFSGAGERFSVVTSGDTEADLLEDFVAIDMAATSISIAYL